MWPVSQQLDWHTQTPRTAIIVCACAYLQIIHTLRMWMHTGIILLHILWPTGDTYIHTIIFQMYYTLLPLPLLSLMFSVWSHTLPALLSVPHDVTGLFSILGYSQSTTQASLLHWHVSLGLPESTNIPPDLQVARTMLNNMSCVPGLLTCTAFLFL